MRKTILILIFALSLGIFAFSVDAQVRNTDIVLSISPESPGTNQSITATLNSYVIDLNKANMSWLLNGEEKSNGVGRKTFSFNSGTSEIDLSVNIETIDGQNLTKTITINPTDVDLLWEAYDVYSPPFYKGKTLTPSQGKWKVVAIPSIRTSSGLVSPANLSYKWKLDGNVQNDSSGWGKNYYIFTNTYLDQQNTVEVEVTDITGSTKAVGKTVLRSYSPKILFYEKDPVLGINWANTITGGLSIPSEGTTLVAEPYFFSHKDLNSSDLSFDWYINGSKISTPDPKNILSIKPEAGRSGFASIKLMVENTKTLFQNMESQIQIQF